ncbi:hypothetical protein CIG19_04980 [Enterobacterales bacterium CwR94]|nr:hypothetical protein CIG19_04980 [Enterobacterales bacterium CwR94]
MKMLIDRFTQSTLDSIMLRLSVIFIFALFGTFKWFEFEVQALQPLISSTWLNILYTLFGVHGGSYFLGAAETLTFIALILGFRHPLPGIFGAVMTVATGVVTLSLLPQLDELDSFIIKDILLVGAGLTLLKQDLLRYKTLSATGCRVE